MWDTSHSDDIFFVNKNNFYETKSSVNETLPYDKKKFQGIFFWKLILYQNLVFENRLMTDFEQRWIGELKNLYF